MLDRTWLLAQARFERDALGRTVQYTPPDRWDAPSSVEGWRVKDVVAHLAAADTAAAAIVGDEPPTEFEEFVKSLDGEPFTVDDWNEWSVRRRADEPVVPMARDWGRAADLLLARVSNMTPQDWDTREIPWIAGEMKLGYFVQSRVAEWWVRGEDILEGGGLPPRLEHGPIFCVNDFAVQLIPYALSLEGKSFGERSVKIDLEGVGEGSWRRGLAPGYDPPKDGKPDVYIEGRGFAFASVAGGRADPYVCLYEGLLNYGGDEEIAEAVLTTLRSFP